MIRWEWADPGETVGWASGRVFEAGDRGRVTPKLIVDDYGQDKQKTYVMGLRERAAQLDLIGFESYHITARELQAHLGSDVPTLQVIGMIRMAAWEGQRETALPFPYIYDQPPLAKRTGMASAKLWAPDLVPIIAEALAGPHDDGHYGDALLHAIAWFHLKVMKDYAKNF